MNLREEILQQLEQSKQEKPKKIKVNKKKERQEKERLRLLERQWAVSEIKEKIKNGDIPALWNSVYSDIIRAIKSDFLKGRSSANFYREFEHLDEKENTLYIENHKIRSKADDNEKNILFPIDGEPIFEDWIKEKLKAEGFEFVTIKSYETIDFYSTEIDKINHEYDMKDFQREFEREARDLPEYLAGQFQYVKLKPPAMKRSGQKKYTALSVTVDLYPPKQMKKIRRKEKVKGVLKDIGFFFKYELPTFLVIGLFFAAFIALVVWLFFLRR